MRSVEAISWRSQSGVALVISLLFLLVVTIISITAATNSSTSLKMSANMQDSYQSFQAAEAGINATVGLGLRGGSSDPFRRDEPVVTDPFDGVSPNPLRNLAVDPENPTAVPVDVDVFLVAQARACPRPGSERGGSSVGTFDCDYYRITSEHNMPGRARSRVELGIVKTLIGANE